MTNAAFTQASDGSIIIAEQAPFTHAHHLELAFFLLQRCDFFEAIHLFVKALKVLVAAVGVRDKFHSTITLAYMALVAERMETTTYTNFASFVDDNQDLLDKKLLLKWYSNQQLDSQLARKIFVLPLTA